MCTNLAQDILTSSGMSRFDSTRNLAQTIYWKKLCQSSKLQLSLLCEDVDVFYTMCFTGLSSLLNSAHGIWEDWVHS